MARSLKGLAQLSATHFFSVRYDSLINVPIRSEKGTYRTSPNQTLAQV